MEMNEKNKDKKLCQINIKNFHHCITNNQYEVNLSSVMIYITSQKYRIVHQH